MMSKAMGMKRVERKQLRFKCTKIVLPCSYHIYQCYTLKKWVALALIQYQGDFQGMNLLSDQHKVAP